MVPSLPESPKDTGVYMNVDQILSKIIADANQDAETLMENAKSEAAAREDAIRETANRQIAETEKKSQIHAAETERRRMLTAGLDARKNTLSRRRVLLDQAFSMALDAYVSLPEADYLALVTKLIVAASETGKEKVLVPPQDEKRYTGDAPFLSAANDALLKAGKPGELTFGGVLPKLRSGVVLSGEIADIDCSFEALVAQFRETQEMNVSKILFEGEV